MPMYSMETLLTQNTLIYESKLLVDDNYVLYVLLYYIMYYMTLNVSVYTVLVLNLMKFLILVRVCG